MEGCTDMGKLSVVESVTLDGVIQAPGRPDEDTRFPLWEEHLEPGEDTAEEGVLERRHPRVEAQPEPVLPSHGRACFIVVVA